MIERERLARKFNQLRDACLEAYDSSDPIEHDYAAREATRVVRSSIIMQRLLVNVIERKGVHDALWERTRALYPSRQAFEEAMSKTKAKLY